MAGNGPSLGAESCAHCPSCIQPHAPPTIAPMPTKFLLPRCVHRPQQAYVPPFLDLRYITSITNDGLEVSCQTFQRHFSRRYVPFRPAGPPPLPAGTLVGTASGSPAGPAAAAAAAAEAEEEAASPAVDAAGLLDAAAESADVQLDERVLADMEHSLGRTLGPVDPGLKMQVRLAALLARSLRRTCFCVCLDQGTAAHTAWLLRLRNAVLAAVCRCGGRRTVWCSTCRRRGG